MLVEAGHLAPIGPRAVKSISLVRLKPSIAFFSLFHEKVDPVRVVFRNTQSVVLSRGESGTYGLAARLHSAGEAVADVVWGDQQTRDGTNTMQPLSRTFSFHHVPVSVGNVGWLTGNHLYRAREQRRIQQHGTAH